MVHDILIVGAGQAGAQAAISLRQGGFAGSICIVGDEPDPPYERPPLSKDFLAGLTTADRLLLRPLDFWALRNVTLQLGQRVDSVDAVAHEVRTTSGDTIGYRSMIWATGGSPRALPVPGGDLAGVHAIRTRADVDRLKAELAGARSIAIVGGGYIGLEVAAVLSKAGKQVTVLEALDRVLARVTAEPVSRFYEDEHRAHGVDVRTGTSIAELVGVDGRVAAVRFGPGEPDLPCDLVIVGIGIVPSIGALALAGAATGNGVEVDEYCRTSLADIYAIGDCANHANPYAAGQRLRLESVQNAVDQAKVVAGVLLGNPQPYRSMPWFWSNQFDLKLQTVGLSVGYDDYVVRGNPSDRSWTLAYLRQGRVIAFDCINTVRDYVQGKALVEAGVASDRAMLADTMLPLKNMKVPELTA
jgi:3-phenylpropionate/trans-cinnamate dioxygenase ferredoxin reductase subunit